MNLAVSWIANLKYSYSSACRTKNFKLKFVVVYPKIHKKLYLKSFRLWIYHIGTDIYVLLPHSYIYVLLPHSYIYVLLPHSYIYVLLPHSYIYVLLPHSYIYVPITS